MWTNPDGFSWIEMLQEEAKVGLHVALTVVERDRLPRRLIRPVTPSREAYSLPKAEGR